MAPGRISAAALLVLAQHLDVDAFSVSGFGTAVRSHARTSAAAPSMVASAAPGKPMTREMQRKQERLEQERIRKFVTPPETYENQPLSTATHEHLIGEEMVNDDASASALADKCIAEAERLFASEEGWTKVLEEDGIFVETKDVAGPYLKSGVRVVRGLGAIKADADDFYNFQVRVNETEMSSHMHTYNTGFVVFREGQRLFLGEGGIEVDDDAPKKSGRADYGCWMVLRSWSC